MYVAHLLVGRDDLNQLSHCPAPFFHHGLNLLCSLVCARERELALCVCVCVCVCHRARERGNSQDIFVASTRSCAKKTGQYTHVLEGVTIAPHRSAGAPYLPPVGASPAPAGRQNAEAQPHQILFPDHLPPLPLWNTGSLLPQRASSRSQQPTSKHPHLPLSMLPFSQFRSQIS